MLNKRMLWLIAAIVLCGALGLTVQSFRAGPVDEPTGPTLWTDKQKYSPGQYMYIGGSGFGPLETVQLYIYKGTLSNPNAELRAAFPTFTDGAGGFSQIPYVWPNASEPGIYTIKAVGQTSGLEATLKVIDPPGGGTNMNYIEMDGNTAIDPGNDWSFLFNLVPNPYTGAANANADPKAVPLAVANGDVVQSAWANDQGGGGYKNGQTPKAGFAGEFDGTTFTGSKDINIITFPGLTAGWQCTGENGPQDKTDIMHAYASLVIPTADFPPTGVDRPTRVGHKLLYMALERHSNNGTASVGFWFLRDRNAGCAINNLTETANVTRDFTGQHQDGDLLIASDFTNGGAVSAVVPRCQS
jgi:hypothetical protein